MEEKKKHKILLAEDDSNLGALLCEFLQGRGYAAVLTHDGEEAYNAFKAEKYDLCIFDVMMPKKDGFTLAKEVRMINVDVPIVFLTARNMKEDVLQGFKIGADDYLTKPFSMEELIMRIEAILRRLQAREVHVRHAEAAARLCGQWRGHKVDDEGERATEAALHER